MSVAAMALSFVLSLAIALVYVALDMGHQKGREVAQTLALAGLVSSVIVLAIDDQVIRGIGLVGAVMMALGCRGAITHPRDVVFATAASAVGVAAGAYAWTVGIGGTVLFVVAALLVSRPWFARVNCLKAALTVTIGPEAADQDAVALTLSYYCDTLALVRVRQVSPFVQERAYHVQLKRARDGPVLVEALTQVVRVEDATLVMDTPATRQVMQSHEP